MRRFWIVVLASLISISGFAQTTRKSTTTKKKKQTGSSRAAGEDVTVRAQRTVEERRGFSADVRLNSLLFGNFFQAPAGAEEEDVLAAGVEGRFTMPLERSGPREGYLHLDYLHFDQEGFGGSPGVRLGARSDGRPHGWDVSAQLQQDRPATDVGDEIDQADLTRLNGDYSYRLSRDWQFGLGADLEQQSFDIAEQRDNQFLGAGASIRYRGFGSGFSPEIGFAVGQRDVDDETENYGQSDVIVQVRSAPIAPLYLSARYRHRIRDYDTSVTVSPNFQREDTRDQIVLSADLRAGRQLTWNFYVAHEDVDSTLASRTFDTLLAAFGLTYRLR